MPAWFELRRGRIEIRVNDASARYPVRIDPFVQRGELTASDGGSGDRLGYSVAVSGNTVVAGAYVHEVGSNSGQGAVYVFTMPGGGWANGTQSAELTASDGAFNDNLGASVAISGDTIVAGAPSHRGASGFQHGATYIFTMPAGGWTSGTQKAELTASDGASGDQLGQSVAISGDTVVAGAPSAETAYVFVKPDGGWRDGTQTAELTQSDGEIIDEFGRSVAESANTIVVGSPGHSPGRSVTGEVGAGAVYVFVKPVSGWTDGTQTAELTASDHGGDARLGTSVAIANDRILAGAPRPTSTATRGGSAYVFVKPAGGWADGTQTAELTPSDDRLWDNFGFSVGISGDVALVGAIQQPPVADGAQGAAYVFEMPGTGWANATEDATLTASDAVTGDWLGFSVAVDGYTTVAAAPYHAVGPNREQGAVYVFRPAPGVAISRPVDGGVFPQGQEVRAAFTCSPDPVATVASCTAPVASGEPVDTVAAGVHTFTVTAVDSLGSTSSRTVHYTVVGRPTLAITSPVDGRVMGQGQIVRAAFSCAAQPGASITRCAGPALNGQPVDTVAAGVHTFTVTAVDSLGSTSSRTVHYTVVGRPTLAITSPVDGRVMGQGQIVRAAFSCAAQPGASITRCAGPALNGQPVDTVAAGVHTFTVTAVDSLGSTSSRTVHYTVVGPPRVTSFSQSAKTWLTHRSKSKRRSLGVTYSFTVDQDATAVLAFAQQITGRRVNGKCIGATPQNHRRPVCTRAIGVGELRLHVVAGRHAAQFVGQLSGRRLKPGSYRVEIIATNVFGQRSAPRPLYFTIAA